MSAFLDQIAALTDRARDLGLAWTAHVLDAVHKLAADECGRLP